MITVLDNSNDEDGDGEDDNGWIDDQLFFLSNGVTKLTQKIVARAIEGSINKTEIA